MIVAADGTGDVLTIQEAIDQVPACPAEPVVIRVRAGIYREKLTIDKPRITLIGEGVERTVITYDDYARKPHPDGGEYGTFRSYTAFIGGDDFTAEGIAFANTAGYGDDIGQAIAAYVDGDRARFRRCRFLGRQDTLFTGPLPPKPLTPGSFAGPREEAPRRHVRQYYEDCYIEGDVDFIFGSATAVFERCVLFAKNRHRPGAVNGWYTAASTPEAAEFGYVFLNCKLTGDAPPASVLLGRPWRNYAKTAFLHCWMDELLRPEGWDNWNKPEAEETVTYGEYDCTGPGAADDGRVPWSRTLSPEEAARYTAANVLGGADGWTPFG